MPARAVASRARGRPVKPGWRILVHRVGAVLWALLLIPAVLWWQTSVLFVIIASVYANVKSDFGAAEAADDRAVLDRLSELEQTLERIEAAVTRGAPADAGQVPADPPDPGILDPAG